MKLKLYEYNEKDNTYYYCGGYLTFNDYTDLAKYIYILMCDYSYGIFGINFIKDIRGYSTNDFKRLFLYQDLTLCLFTVSFDGVTTEYKICLGVED